MLKVLKVLKVKLKVLQHSLNSDLPVEDRDFLLLRTIHQFFCMEYLSEFLDAVLLVHTL